MSGDVEIREDGGPPALAIPCGRVRLESARDARKFVARLARQVYQGRLDAGVAGRIAYSLSVFLKAVEIEKIEDIEARLEALERPPAVRPVRLNLAHNQRATLRCTGRGTLQDQELLPPGAVD